MGFTLTEHKCSLPDTTETRLRLHYTAGTVWQCDECGKFYGLNSEYNSRHMWPLEREWFWVELPPPVGEVHTPEEVQLAFYERYQKQQADRLAYNEMMKAERDKVPKVTVNEETQTAIVGYPEKKKRWGFLK